MGGILLSSSELVSPPEYLKRSGNNMLRRIAEIVFGPITVYRKLPAFVGSGIVVASPNTGGLRYLFRSSSSLDPVLLGVASALVRRGDVVWDVGGNIGLFAAAASGIAGKDGGVYTIEPDKDAHAFLNRTARAQSGITHAPITTLNAAISNQCGCVEFNIAKRSRSANSMRGFGSTQTGGVKECRLVPALTLDILLNSFPNPQVLKIDVEGAEVLVLQGAKQLLTTARPAVIVEVSGEVSHEVARILRSHDYRLYDGSTFNAIGIDEPAPWDTVALPSESDLCLAKSNRG